MASGLGLAELRPEVRSAAGRSYHNGGHGELRPEVRSAAGRSDHLLSDVSLRSAACSTCHGMLAHFTRIGNLATPANAASSPSVRASCSFGRTFPVTSP